MLRLEHILKEERKESLDVKSSRAVECSLAKRHEVGQEERKREASRGLKEGIIKGKITRSHFTQ